MNAYVEIFIIFILPVILWAIGILKNKHRELGIVVMSLLAGLFIYLEKWPWVQLGIRTDNFSKSILPYLLYTILSIVFLRILAAQLGKRKNNQWWEDWHVWFWFTIGSILQEFVYRAFLTGDHPIELTAVYFGACNLPESED
jgi:hypothetical protein